VPGALWFIYLLTYDCCAEWQFFQSVNLGARPLKIEGCVAVFAACSQLLLNNNSKAARARLQ
jgi:hypothetical protein